MKIFNWVQRRFSTDHKEGSAENYGKQQQQQQQGDYNNEENEKRALLDQNKIVHHDVYWGSSSATLLSIGTLGQLVDPLKHYLNPPMECCHEINNYYHQIAELEEDGEDDIITINNINNNAPQSDHPVMTGDDDEGVVELPAYNASGSSNCDHEDQTAALIKSWTDDDDALELDEKMVAVEKKGRVTLAYLFSAETMAENSTGPNTLLSATIKKEQLPNQVNMTAEALPLPKKKNKLNPRISPKQISPSLQKMMKKMFKTKIHPDVDAKIKSRTPTDLAPTDSVSLLHPSAGNNVRF